MSDNLHVRNKFVQKVIKQTDRLNKSLHLLYDIDKLLLIKSQKGGMGNNELEDLWNKSSKLENGPNVTGTPNITYDNSSIIKQVDKLSDELGNKLENLKKILSVVNAKLSKTKEYDLSKHNIKVDNKELELKLTEFQNKIKNNPILSSVEQIQKTNINNPNISSSVEQIQKTNINKPNISSSVFRTIESQENSDNNDDDDEDENEIELLKPITVRSPPSSQPTVQGRPVSPTASALEEQRNRLRSSQTSSTKPQPPVQGRPVSPTASALEEQRNRLRSSQTSSTKPQPTVRGRPVSPTASALEEQRNRLRSSQTNTNQYRSPQLISNEVINKFSNARGENDKPDDDEDWIQDGGRRKRRSRK